MSDLKAVGSNALKNFATKYSQYIAMAFLVAFVIYICLER